MWDRCARREQVPHGKSKLHWRQPHTDRIDLECRYPSRHAKIKLNHCLDDMSRQVELYFQIFSCLIIILRILNGYSIFLGLIWCMPKPKFGNLGNVSILIIWSFQRVSLRIYWKNLNTVFLLIFGYWNKTQMEDLDLWNIHFRNYRGGMC